jgi:hypothetical protein
MYHTANEAARNCYASNRNERNQIAIHSSNSLCVPNATKGFALHANVGSDTGRHGFALLWSRLSRVPLSALLLWRRGDSPQITFCYCTRLRLSLSGTQNTAGGAGLFKQ